MLLRIETPTEKWLHFSTEYLRVRDAEGRFFSDSELAILPQLPANHPLKSEFVERAKTLKLLRKYIQRDSNVLDLGCGNGWMTNQLAKSGIKMTGVDVNLPELEQAARVFSGANLAFVFADVFAWQPNEKFETAIISSAIQYFKFPKQLLQTLFENCPTLQNIIICDSPFYAESEIASAKKRTKTYYAQFNATKMAEHYVHHTVRDLGHPWHYIYKPYVSVMRHLFGGPQFPIIEIRRDDCNR